MPLVQTLDDYKIKESARLLVGFELEMYHAPAGCLRNSICPPDRIELVDQSTDMELGGMN